MGLNVENDGRIKKFQRFMIDYFKSIMLNNNSRFKGPNMFTIENELIHIGEELGRGNYSVVCKVFWRSQGVKYENALKLMYGTSDEFKNGYLDSYVREVFCSSVCSLRTGVIQLLQKPNVGPKVKVFDYGILMKEAKFSLKNLLSYSDMKRPPLHAVRLISKLCLKSLNNLHLKGIMHRDVKPDNFLVFFDQNDNHKKDNSFHIELVDFSLSTIMEKSNTKSVVTLWWRPLELFFENYYHTKNVDIWSLGIVFLELITGRNLFRGYKEDKKIIEIILFYWGFPSQEEWPELHKQFKIDAAGKDVKLPRLQYGLLNEETTYYKSFMGILHSCFILKDTDRKSCTEMLDNDFFKMVPSALELEETNIWLIEAFHNSGKDKYRKDYYLSDDLPPTYGVYNFKDKMSLLTFDDKEEEKNLKRKREDDTRKEMIERILSCESFLRNLCINCNIGKCTLDDPISHPRKFFVLIFLQCCHLNDVHIASIIVTCMYISTVLTTDESPTFYQMIDLINTNKDEFYKDCVKIFPKILKILNCEFPNADNDEVKNLLKNKEIDWIMG